MNIIQEVQKKKKKRRENVFQNLQKNCLMQEKILLIFLKKELFHIKLMYLKQKKKKNKKTNFLNTLRINQKVLTMNCLKNILIPQHLLFWQKNYLQQKIKRKTMTS